MTTKNNGVLNWAGEFSPKLKREFDGKLVIIAGGGDGIGAALADGYHALGAKVAILDINTAGAEQQSQKLQAARPKKHPTHFYQADLTNESKATEVVQQAVRDAGTAPYVFISTVGMDRRGKFMETPTEDVIRQAVVNAYGAINPAKATYREMRAADTADGTFILFSSGHANRITAPDMEAYGAGKNVLLDWTRRFSHHAGTQNQDYRGNVRAVTFEPGWVETEQQIKMLKNTGADPAAVFTAASKESLIPVRMKPEHVARSVIHLSSNEFFLLTDARVELNGGEGKVARKTAIDAGATTGGIERTFSGGHISVPHAPKKSARRRKDLPAIPTTSG